MTNIKMTDSFVRLFTSTAILAIGLSVLMARPAISRERPIQIDPDRFEIEVLEDLDTGLRNPNQGAETKAIALIVGPTAHGLSACYLRTQVPPRSSLVISRGRLRATRLTHAVFRIERLQPGSSITDELGPAATVATLECWRGSTGTVEGDVGPIIEQINKSTRQHQLRARAIELQMRVHRISYP